MNNNNLHRIFADTKCFSTEMMMDYLNGELSEKERNMLEVHLVSCEMCRDEFEGLSLLEDQAKLSVVVVNLDRKIDERVKKGVKKISLIKPLYKIAATVIILVASVWFIRLYIDSSAGNFEEDQVSYTVEENTKPKILEEKVSDSPNIQTKSKISTEKDRLKRDEIDRVSTPKGRTFGSVNLEKERQGLDKNKDAEVGNAEYVEEEISVDYYSEIDTETIPVNEKMAGVEDVTKDEVFSKNKEEFKTISGKDVKKQQDPIKSGEVTEKNINTDYKSARSNNKYKSGKLIKAKTDQGVKLSNTLAVNNFDLALDEFNKRKYKEAIELFKRSLDVHSKPDEVYFYLAKSYSNIKDTKRALTNYNKVIAEHASPYYEKALWDKSQILLELNKRKSSINSLKRLKKYNGDYSKKASIILDSLKSK